jgi:hypothetical protein
MAKKTNYIPYILGAAAVGGVVLWQSGKLDKLFGKKTSEAPEVPPLEIKPEVPVVKKEVNVVTPPNPLKNPVYIDAVKKLQLFLGAGVDGDAGGENSQTNKMLKAKFPALYANLGRVTPSNVNAYLTESTKKSQVDVALAANKARKAFGEKLFALHNAKKTVLAKSTISSVPVRYFDVARNIYAPSGQSINIVKGAYSLFTRWNLKGFTNDGFFVLQSKDKSTNFILLNPYSFEAR